MARGVKSDTLIWGALLGLLFMGGGTVAYIGTRGLRNNNPGNIEYDGTAWEGLASPPSDGTFCVFVSPEYGIRALGRVISNYIALDGVPSTVTDIISRFAPPADNDTLSYIQAVDSDLGLPPGNDAINLSTQMAPLVAAIIRHENGVQPYSANTIATGLALA